jgi:hypothetical protein
MFRPDSRIFPLIIVQKASTLTAAIMHALVACESVASLFRDSVIEKASYIEVRRAAPAIRHCRAKGS